MYVAVKHITIIGFVLKLESSNPRNKFITHGFSVFLLIFIAEQNQKLINEFSVMLLRIRF